MLPRPAKKNLLHRRSCYAVFGGKHLCGNDARLPSLADFDDIGVGEFGVRILLTRMRQANANVGSVQFSPDHRVWFTALRSPFRDKIAGVLGFGPDPKMAGIHAPAMVSAGACVTNTHAVRNRANPEFVRKPVSSNGGSADVKATVPVAVSSAGPRPARIGTAGLVHVPEKAFNVTSRYDGGHQRGPFALVGPRMFAASRGHYVAPIIPDARVL